MNRYIVLVFMLLGNICLSQDFVVSNTLLSPVWKNPAFVGTSKYLRASAFYRNQWSELPGSFITSGLSADMTLANPSSSVGFSVFQDKAGVASTKSVGFSGYYAHSIPLSSLWNVRLGAQLGVFQRKVDVGNQVFSSQIDPITGSVSGFSGEPVSGIATRMSPDLGLGMLAHSSSWLIGMSAQHLNKPNIAIGGKSPLPIRINAQVGYQIHAEVGNSTHSKLPITVLPLVQFSKQAQFTQRELGVYVSASPMLAGISFRSSKQAESMVFSVGFKQEFLSVGYSYDHVLSSLSHIARASHEITLCYRFKNTLVRSASKMPEVFSF